MQAPRLTASESLYGRASKVLAGGGSRTTFFRHPHPIYMDHGLGCHLVDVDGVERLDFTNNATTLIHGYAHPAIVDAVRRQVGLGTCYAYPVELEIQLAELLASRVPSFEHVRFVNSGSEAVMVAIKAARAFTNRSKIAKCEGAYHGMYDYVEVSLDPTSADWGDQEPKPVPYAAGTPAGVLDDVVVLPFNNTAQSEEILARHASELAAIIVDPLPNRIGLIPATPEFLRMLRSFASQNGSVLIFDEVISFRLGYCGAQGEFAIQPDLTTLGKTIGGGFPIGGIAGSREIMAVFDPTHGKPALPQSGTFSANPISMAAGLAAMELLSPATFEHINRLGEMARSEIRRACDAVGVPSQVTGMGSLFQVHLTNRVMTDYRSGRPSAEERAARESLCDYLLDHGVSILPHVAAAISTPMTGTDIGMFVEVLADGLKHIGSSGAVRPEFQ